MKETVNAMDLSTPLAQCANGGGYEQQIDGMFSGDRGLTMSERFDHTAFEESPQKPSSMQRAITDESDSGDFSRINQEMTNVRNAAEGSFGKICVGKYDLDGQRYCVKQSKKHIGGESDLQRRLQEVYALSACKHPHVLHYNEAWIDERLLSIRTEVANEGSIRRLPRPWPEADLWDLLFQMALALHALHACRTVHLDVKPDNIFLLFASPASTYYVLGDFGLARPIPDAATETGEIFRTFDDEGDKRYLCPVLLQQVFSYYSFLREADVYALGATLVDLMGGDPSAVRHGKLTFNAQPYSVKLCDIVRQMTHLTPSERPTAFQVALAAQTQRMAQDDAVQQAFHDVLDTRMALLSRIQQELEELEHPVEDVR